MATHVKNEESRQLRLREQALRELEEIAPEIVKRFRAAEAALEELRTPREQLYQRYKSNLEAVAACLSHEKRWMRRYEIADALQAGGYLMDPVDGRRNVVWSIDKAAQRGKLAREGDLIGLLEWLKTDIHTKKS